MARRISYAVAVIAEECEALYAESYGEISDQRRDEIEARLDQLEADYRREVGLA